jgi:hypothetical protein
MYLNKDYFFEFKITEDILKKVFSHFKSININNPQIDTRKSISH